MPRPSPKFRMLDASDFDVKVTRKPAPEPETFHCPICEREILLNQSWWSQRQEVPFGEICTYCNSHWSNRGSGEIPQVDRLPFRALNAITNALEWEIKNGRQAAINITL